MGRGNGERYSDYILSDEANRRPSVSVSQQQAAVLARSAAMYPEVPAGTHVAASQMANGNVVLDQANTAAMQSAPPKKKRKKSLWQKATGVGGTALGKSFEGIGMAGDFLTPKPVENVLKPIGNVVQPTVRGAAAIASTPLQAAVGTGRELYGLGTGQTKWAGWDDFGNDIAEQTTLGQVFKAWGLPGTGGGSMDLGRDVDLGSGFFPSQESAIEQARVTKERSTGMIGNSAWTPGRWLAVDGFGLDQGSDAYNLMSGIGDGLIAWYGDPMNLMVGKASEAGRAAKLGTEIVGESKVARAADRADPAWRAIVDEALGKGKPAATKAESVATVAERAVVDPIEALRGTFVDVADDSLRGWEGMNSTEKTNALLDMEKRLRDETGVNPGFFLDGENEGPEWLFRETQRMVDDHPEYGPAEWLNTAMQMTRESSSDAVTRGGVRLSDLYNADEDWFEPFNAEELAAAIKGRRAALAPSTEAGRSLLDDSMGVVKGAYDAPRDSVLASNAAKWLYGDEGRRAVGRMKDIKSTTQLWEDTGMKFPLEVAHKIAQSDDEVEIANVLVSALTSSVRDLPAMGRRRGLGMADRFVKNRQAVGRLFNMVPDTRIEWDDVEGSFRNLRNSAANVGIHGEERAKLLDKWAEALVSPIEKRQARYNATKLWGETLNAQLKSQGVPDALADSASSWTKKLDQINQYDVDDWGHGISFADDSGTGPFLVSQLLETGMYLYDPKSVRQLRELTAGKAMHWVARNPGWRYSVSFAAGLQNDLWKPAQLIGPKYLAKILPEEYGRVALGGAIKGPLGWMHTVFGDQYSVDATGGAFKSLAERAEGLVGEKSSYEDILFTSKDAAVKAEATNALKEIDDELAALNEEISGHATDVYSEAMNRKYSKKAGVDYGSNQLYEEGRISGNDRRLRDRYEDMLRQQVRRGNMQQVSAQQDLDRWAVGQGQSILGLHGDEIARRVANGGLFQADLVDPATQGFRQGLDGIVDWLNMGEGRKWRDAMEEYAVSRNPNFNGPIARDMVNVAADDVMHRTGNDPQLLQAIVTGQLGGEKIIGQLGAVTGNVPSSDLTDALKQVWNNGNPDISEKAGYLASEVGSAGAKARDMERAMAVKDTMTRWFFQSVYGKSSDKLNRSPAFRSYYWRRVEELIPHMDAQTAREMLDEAAGTIPKRQLASMEKKVLKANGDLDREAVNSLAGHAALEDTTDLLFDASSRTQLFDILRVVMPFGEAWREIVTSYSRLIRQNPRALRRFQQTINGLRGSGVMYKNEYGEESVSIPLSGPLVGLITGGESKASMSMSAKSLSIGTSVIPGIGPALSGPIYHFIPDKPGTEWVRDTLFPYGKPQALDAIPAPAWAKKLFESTGWVDGKTAFSTQNQVMNQLYARDPEKYADDPELLISDAKAVSQGVLMARGIAQAFSPGAPSVRYTAETKDGDVAAAKLSDEFRKMQLPEDEGGEGLDYNEAVAAFLDKYGPGSALYLVGNTEAKVKGLDASAEFTDFERENGWLFTSHNETAGYFGPHGGEFDYTTYTRQLEAGYRRQLTPNERIAAANQVIGNMMVRNEEEILEAEKPRDEWTAVETGYMKFYKSKLETELAGYTQYDAYDVNQVKRQMTDVFDAAADPRLVDNATAQAVRDYQKERALVLQKMSEDGMVGLGSKQATIYRSYLEWKGMQMAQETPGFQTVWDRLLSREVEATDE